MEALAQTPATHTATASPAAPPSAFGFISAGGGGGGGAVISGASLGSLGLTSTEEAELHAVQTRAAAEAHEQELSHALHAAGNSGSCAVGGHAAVGYAHPSAGMAADVMGAAGGGVASAELVEAANSKRTNKAKVGKSGDALHAPFMKHVHR